MIPAKLTSVFLLTFAMLGCNRSTKNESKPPPNSQMISEQQQSQGLYPYSPQIPNPPSGQGGSLGRGGGLDSGSNWDSINGVRVYRVGRGIMAPRPIDTPGGACSSPNAEPKQRPEVMLWAVIGTDGRVHNTRILWSPTAEAGELALQRLVDWRFVPAHKDHQPVAVQVNITVYSCT